MIINATTGTGFLGAISYIHKEHEKDFSQEQKPEILEENMVFGTVPEQAYLMRSIAIRNAKSSRPVLHLSISFHQEEIISEETRDLIFDKILEELGATRDNNQFIIAQHFDAAHEHYHILLNKVGFDRSNINTSYIVNKCQVIADKIEKEVDLRRTPGRTVIYDPTNPKGFRYTTPEERNKKEIFLDKSVGVRDVKTFLKKTIDSLMQQTFNVTDLLEKLEKNGIDCRTNFSQDGILKGISFKYNNQSYKGTQIGLKSKEIENFYVQKNQDLIVEKTSKNFTKPENIAGKSAKENHEKTKIEFTKTIKKLEKMLYGYKNATQKVADKIMAGEIKIDALIKNLEDSNFKINNQTSFYEGFSFDTDILIRWMERNITSIEKQKKEYEQKILEYNNLMNQPKKETSFLMFFGNKRKIKSENEELDLKKQMAIIPKLDISGIGCEIHIQQEINLEIKRYRDRLQDLEVKEKNRIVQEEELKRKQEAEKPISKVQMDKYQAHREKFMNSEDYKTNFLEYYEHESILKDLYWLDKHFSHLETEHDKIQFLKLNFGLNDNEAFYLSERFFQLDPKVNLIKKQIINSLPDRLIRDDENDYKINKGMRLR
ncbi:relaxase/mobilization nuclease domain-containing protein [Chryseobacterium sp. Ch-15]|uniref:Relaxase/mobilization nuclease domain-containing protein n=1 Tax=Chryseobacterium muglaense TaxID=2893752 RepID=A0A9Q3UYS3_9FLAO|nr:relaxase/mobilization nuclease domain-containing protein [Chryseobacterium muglaense]MBD3906424.1 relaxase/mobilization nuclease domain-containing protein [Chryseobacterium muglaense]MCC9037067.1 relaxase/mobilization nuclease domain-containing protein [Chryseobacterium muglaense]MCM2556642.1 relaxase/mobilization nuclease domain-containing protein [Chryseobacterium muglaense]